jgi:nucleoside-diphosphate-sugar epimerase
MPLTPGAWKTGRAIITGATGPVGMALIARLAGCGIGVTAVLRPGSARNAHIPRLDGVDLIECDIAALPSLAERLPHGYDAFFHLAWNTATREITGDPIAQGQSLVHTLHAVKLAAALGCKVFVGSGSQAEYGRACGPLSHDTPERPESSYGIAKYAAGKLSRQLSESLGMRHCWCRIISVYGPFDRATTGLMYCLNGLLRGEKPSLTKAEQLWDYIYSADCARALHLIAEKGRHGTAYPVGSGRARPLREYFETLRDCIDPGLPLGFGEKPYPPGQIMHLSADITGLTKDTGFLPEYSFEEGIRRTVEWARSSRAGP